MMRRRTLLTAPLLAAGAARAQGRYPDRPIRLIIPVAVAGATDIVGRILADAIAPALGRPVVVENVVGAASTVGAAAFQRAPADGYTLFLGTNNHAVMRAVYPNFPHDPVADFLPLALVSRQPFLLTTSTAVPARTVPELLAWLRQRGEAANYGATAPGANNHVAGELLKQRAGLSFTIVPYRAAAASAQDLAAGRLDLTIDTPTLLLPLIRAGAARGLAVTSAEPSALVPGVPSLQQEGVADYDMTAWTILFTRPGTPPEVVAALQDAAIRALADPATVRRMAAAGFEPWPDGSATAAAAHLRREVERWTPMIAAMNLSPG